jgi:hypothetical protein
MIAKGNRHFHNVQGKKVLSGAIFHGIFRPKTKNLKLVHLSRIIAQAIAPAAQTEMSP